METVELSKRMLFERLSRSRILSKHQANFSSKDTTKLELMEIVIGKLALNGLAERMQQSETRPWKATFWICSGLENVTAHRYFCNQTKQQTASTYDDLKQRFSWQNC